MTHDRLPPTAYRRPPPLAPPACLAIGGFDPSGGAGILADVEAIAAAGARPLAVATTITAQNHLLFERALPLPVEMVEAQLDALMYVYPLGAVKTGVLPTARHVRWVAAALRNLDEPIVVDPVLGASRGHGLVAPSVALAIARHLVPMAALVTPNAAEAAVLSGRTVRDAAGAEAAAARILALGARAVLVKGGHLDAPGDLLATPRRRIWLRVTRVRGVPIHGAGCALASAIAGALATGIPLLDAVKKARTLVGRAMRRAGRTAGSWAPDLVALRLAVAGRRS